MYIKQPEWALVSLTNIKFCWLQVIDILVLDDDEYNVSDVLKLTKY